MLQLLIPTLAILLTPIVYGCFTADYIRLSLSFMSPFRPYFNIGIASEQYKAGENIDVLRYTLGLYIINITLEFYKQ